MMKKGSSQIQKPSKKISIALPETKKRVFRYFRIDRKYQLILISQNQRRRRRVFIANTI